MSLSDVKLNTNCVVKEINIEDEKMKIRLMELGLTKGCVVSVNKKSVLKETLLLIFNSNYFTLKNNIAKQIVVNYA